MWVGGVGSRGCKGVWSRGGGDVGSREDLRECGGVGGPHTETGAVTIMFVYIGARPDAPTPTPTDPP